MTPSPPAPDAPQGVDRLVAAADAVAAALAVDGVVAGPAAEQGGLDDLMVAEHPTGGWAEAADGSVVLVLMAPEGAARWPNPATLVDAIQHAAEHLGAAIGELQPVRGPGDLPTDLDPTETTALTGAGLFQGDVPIAAVGVHGSLVPVAVEEPSTGGAAAAASAAPQGANGSASDPATHNLHLLSDVVLGVTAELGRTTMTMGELLELQPGGVIELDREAGTPVDIAVNQTLIARGEVVMVDNRYAVRITEVVADGGLR